jgi:prephenate dehydrogenase
MTTSGEAARTPGEVLMECRNAIEVVDRRIVALLAQRVALGLRAATAKRDAGLPIADPAREADVFANVVAAADEQGLSVGAVRDIFQRIVAMSRRAQEDAR